MTFLALIIGWSVVWLIGLCIVLFIADHLANRATQAWCLSRGAYYLKAYRKNWSRPRMFVWAFFMHYSNDSHTLSHKGRDLMHWNSWRDWSYAGQHRSPNEAGSEQ